MRQFLVQMVSIALQLVFKQPWVVDHVKQVTIAVSQVEVFQL